MGTSGKAVRVRVRVRASRFRSIPLRSAPLRADLFYSSHTYLNLFFGENKIDRMADQQEEETRLMDAPVEMELKRIGFVKDAMKTAEPYYEGLKSKSGPLKDQLETVEKAIEPYYEKYMPYILETVETGGFCNLVRNEPVRRRQIKSVGRASGPRVGERRPPRGEGERCLLSPYREHPDLLSGARGVQEEADDVPERAEEGRKEIALDDFRDDLQERRVSQGLHRVAEGPAHSITLHFRGHRVLRVVGAALRRDCHDKGPALRGHCDDERVSVLAEDRQGGVGLVSILSLGQFT